MQAAIVITNIITALIYAWILWVMVQQRRVMSEQLREMQAARTAAYRPMLVVRMQQEVSQQRLFIVNIGNGPALDIRLEVRFGDLVAYMVIPPLGTREQIAPMQVFYPREEEIWLITYCDLFGNTYTTQYFRQEERHIFEG